MNKQKRKKFFIKGNFQITIILGFTLFLFIEVLAAGWFIYKLSFTAIENASFKSHLTIDKGAQIIAPVILRINISVITITVLFSSLAAVIFYFRTRALFRKIIFGLENFKRNNMAFRLAPRGGKKTRELIKEFNQAASQLDKKHTELINVLDALLKENKLSQISKLHNKLYLIITG